MRRYVHRRAKASLRVPSPAGPPHGDLGHLGRSGQIWGPPAYENDTPPACGLHWPCIKPPQSSPGSKGSDREHARAPFSAVRASWKLKVDGFSSSRGAVHDPHHEKTTKATTSPRPLGGDRWTPAPRCIFFITFASVTPIQVRRRTKIFAFIIFYHNF